MLSVNTQQEEQQFATIVDIIDSIAAGELVLPDVAPGELPAALQGSIGRLVETLRKRFSVSDRLAIRDDLTGVLTAASFKQAVMQRLSRWPAAAALLSIDLTGLKRINTAHGHAAGDQVLILAASRIVSMLELLHLRNGMTGRPPLVCRFAGGGFGAFLDLCDDEHAVRCAQDIVAALKEPFFVGPGAILLGINVGVALAPEHGHQHDHLAYCAHIAAQAAGTKGQGGWIVFDEELVDDCQQRADAAVSLREALIDEQFSLHFQPQMRVGATDRILTVEALLRWHHPTQGLILPGEFIALAEEVGLIADLGRWVVAAAVRTAARCQASGRPCRIAVNVSGFELLQRDFVAHLQEWLARTGVQPCLIEIEVTESAMMMADEQIIESLSRLRALGVSVAIDDFGVGYSNFSRLASLPVDRLKIDRSLIGDILVNPIHRQIVACIVQLGKALGHEIVVEGVETGDQATVISLMGCDVLQGFHIARPVTEADFLDWLHALPADLLGLASGQSVRQALVA